MHCELLLIPPPHTHLLHAGNYGSEVIEWAGYALAAKSLPTTVFAVFVFSNLVPRGVQHHEWYLSKMGDVYPRSRKAVLPFIV